MTRFYMDQIYYLLTKTDNEVNLFSAISQFVMNLTFYMYLAIEEFLL